MILLHKYFNMGEYLSFHMVKFENELERYHRVNILITVRGNLSVFQL